MYTWELAKHAGAEKVIIADFSRDKLKDAEKSNFDKYVDSSKEDFSPSDKGNVSFWSR